MKRRFHLLAGLIVVGSLAAAGCASEEQVSTQGANEAAKVEQAKTSAVTPTVAANKAVVADRTDKVAKEAPKVDARAVAAAGAVCTLNGAAGTTVECPIRLAVDNAGDAARALQGTLVYDSQVVTFNGFFDKFCPTADNCIERAITAESPNLSTTGHLVTTSPKAATEWNGKGSFILANLTNPQAAISTAKTGDANSAIFKAKFTLKQDAKDVAINIEGVVAADAAANQLATRVSDNTILTGAITR